jgi:hypothetical protein
MLKFFCILKRMIFFTKARIIFIGNNFIILHNKSYDFKQMQQNYKIQRNPFFRILYFALICFLSISSCGYIYNFQEFQFKQKTELVSKQNSEIVKRLYRFKLSSKENTDKNIKFSSRLVWVLTASENQTSVSYNNRKFICFTIDKTCFYPFNKYQYDAEEVVKKDSLFLNC